MEHTATKNTLPTGNGVYSYNFPNSFGEEGIDHINISLSSTLHIGRLMSPDYRRAIVYPKIGKFASVLSLWYWLKSGDFDDAIRRLTGDKLKLYVTTRQKKPVNVPNFKAVIGKATWLKILSSETAVSHIKHLPDNLEVLSYKPSNGSNLRIATPYASVVVDVMKEIIIAVKKDETPDFSKFVTLGDKASNCYLDEFLSRHFKY